MFDDLNKSLAKFKELAGTWPALMVMGSFVLYVLGYLSVRFNLTVLGCSYLINRESELRA